MHVLNTEDGQWQPYASMVRMLVCSCITKRSSETSCTDHRDPRRTSISSPSPSRSWRPTLGELSRAFDPVHLVLTFMHSTTSSLTRTVAPKLPISGTAALHTEKETRERWIRIDHNTELSCPVKYWTMRIITPLNSTVTMMATKSRFPHLTRFPHNASLCARS